jgi:hypothetical protein
MVMCGGMALPALDVGRGGQTTMLNLRLPRALSGPTVALSLLATVAFAQFVIPTPTFATTSELKPAGVTTPGWRVVHQVIRVWMINPITGDRVIINEYSILVYLGWDNGVYMAE